MKSKFVIRGYKHADKLVFSSGYIRGEAIAFPISAINNYYVNLKDDGVNNIKFTIVVDDRPIALLYFFDRNIYSRTSFFQLCLSKDSSSISDADLKVIIEVTCSFAINELKLKTICCFLLESSVPHSEILELTGFVKKFSIPHHAVVNGISVSRNLWCYHHKEIAS